MRDADLLQLDPTLHSNASSIDSKLVSFPSLGTDPAPILASTSSSSVGQKKSSAKRSKSPSVKKGKGKGKGKGSRRDVSALGAWGAIDEDKLALWRATQRVVQVSAGTFPLTSQ